MPTHSGASQLLSADWAPGHLISPLHWHERTKGSQEISLGNVWPFQALGIRSKHLIQGDKLTTHSPIDGWGFLAFTQVPAPTCLFSLILLLFTTICRLIFIFDSDSMYRLR